MSIVLDSKLRLRPCPFCGHKEQFMTDDSTKHKVYVRDEFGKETKAVWVTIHCHKCGCTVHAYGRNKETAINSVVIKWEARP